MCKKVRLSYISAMLWVEFLQVGYIALSEIVHVLKAIVMLIETSEDLKTSYQRFV